ncbi:MAG: lipopolysaccharide biosynthesis protein [Gemmatimonadales bacterium]
MRFFSSLLSLLSWRVVAAAVTVTERLLLAAMLGPSRLGTFGIASSTIAILSRWLSFGATPAAQYAGGRQTGSAPPARAVLLYGALVALAALVICWVATPLIGGLIFGDKSEALEIFVFFRPWLPVLIVGMTLSLFLLGQGRIRIYGALQVLPELGFLAVLVAFWLLGRDLEGALWGQVTAWAVLGVVALAANRSTLAGGRLSRRSFAEVSSYGVRAWPLVFLQFGIARVALLVGARFVEAEALGYYVLASGLADALTLFPGLVAQLVFNAAGRPGPGVRELAFRVIRLSTVALVLGATAVALVGKPLFVLAFGQPYAPAWLVLVVLLGTTVCRGTFALLIAVLSGRGRPGLSNVAQMVELTTLLVLVPIGAVRFGVVGMAGAAVVASVAGLVTAAFLVGRLEGARVTEVLLVRSEDWSVLRRRLGELVRRPTLEARNAD